MRHHAAATPAFLSEHYVYEINMLRASLHLLKRPRSQFHANAFMEAFIVHARVLIDFYSNRPRKDDAIAAHFTVGGYFSGQATAGVSPDTRERMNKQIPHLTYSRTTTKKLMGRDRQTLLALIEVDHAAFKKAVAPEYAGCFADEVFGLAPKRHPAGVFSIAPKTGPRGLNYGLTSG